MTENDYITMVEASKILGVNRQSIYRWVQRGHFPNHLQIGDNGPIRIAVCDIEAFRGKAALPKKQQ